jgi:TonB family protein
MRTSELVRCDDAATDRRIDPVTSQQMNLRSVLIVPVIADGRLQAMLQAVSSKPHAFDADHQELLCRMADRIVELLSDPNRQQSALGLAKQVPATSPQSSNTVETLTAAVAMHRTDTAGGSEDAPSATASAALRPKVVAEQASAPGSEPREQQNAAGPPQFHGEAERCFRLGPSGLASLSSAARAGIVIALLGVVTVGGYVFIGAGHNSSPASAPVSAAAKGGADASSTTANDVPEINIEQSSLAVGLEPAPAGGSNAPQLTPGQLLRKVDPVYPPSARGISGSVVLSALVDKDGRVVKVRVVRGPEELAKPAIDAVSQWIYEPYRLGGAPVAAESMITIGVRSRNQR